MLIGTSEGPLKSHELSKMLDVSDSYLKKVTRQLVVAGLITSKASKLGGFILNKKMNDINHLDAAENQYKQKLKEINLGEITNYVHQNSI